MLNEPEFRGLDKKSSGLGHQHPGTVQDVPEI